jgi:hypothetical protein
MIEFVNRKGEMLDYYDYDYISHLPRVGEFVQLGDGRTFQVKNIIHVYKAPQRKIVIYCVKVTSWL